jgi:hypothetical protein
MGSTLHHFEGYKTLGPKMDTNLINFTLNLTFNNSDRWFPENCEMIMSASEIIFTLDIFPLF